jgi:hypothetical protein
MDSKILTPNAREAYQQYIMGLLLFSELINEWEYHLGVVVTRNYGDIHGLMFEAARPETLTYAVHLHCAYSDQPEKLKEIFKKERHLMKQEDEESLEIWESEQFKKISDAAKLESSRRTTTRERNIIMIPGFNKDLYTALLKQINHYLDERQGHGTDCQNTLALKWRGTDVCIQQLEYDSMEYSVWSGYVGVRYFNAHLMPQYLECEDDFGRPYVKHIELKLQDWELFSNLVVPILQQMGWSGVKIAQLQKNIWTQGGEF